MDTLEMRTIASTARGRDALRISRLAFGGAPLGGLFSAVSDDQALRALQTAWDAGVRYFDTAPLYGHGLSERRVGAFLRTKPRDAFVVSTKVGRLLEPAGSAAGVAVGLADFVGALPYDPVFDFRADAIKRSMHDSLERLGLDRVDIAYLHDPDEHYDAALTEAYPVLHAMRDEGVIDAIGAGMNQWQMLERFIENCDFDAIILAGRYTLLDRSAAASLLPLCARRNVTVVAAGVFNSGILAARAPGETSTYDYVRAPDHIVARARAMAAVCEEFGTTLPVAAIQFPLRHPAIGAVLLGMRTADEVEANVAAFRATLPDALWPALDSVG